MPNLRQNVNKLISCLSVASFPAAFFWLIRESVRLLIIIHSLLIISTIRCLIFYNTSNHSHSGHAPRLNGLSWRLSTVEPQEILTLYDDSISTAEFAGAFRAEAPNPLSATGHQTAT